MKKLVFIFLLMAFSKLNAQTITITVNNNSCWNVSNASIVGSNGSCMHLFYSPSFSISGGTSISFTITMGSSLPPGWTGVSPTSSAEFESGTFPIPSPPSGSFVPLSVGTPCSSYSTTSSTPCVTCAYVYASWGPTIGGGPGDITIDLWSF